MLRTRRAGGFRNFRRKRQTLWLGGALYNQAIAANTIQAYQLTSPFLHYGGVYSVIDPTFVRAKLEMSLASGGGAGVDLHGAWGIIKAPVDQDTGLVNTADVPEPNGNPWADWITHGYYFVPSVVPGVAAIEWTQASNGLIDAKSKRKMGEMDVLVLVVTNLGAAVVHGFGYRCLFLGARR
jgi:hypothetical protein